MANGDELDVIVVGAGLAGLACAYEAASAGLQVAVLERGDAAGSKSLSGGRLYLQPVQKLCNDFLANAPFERPVVSESIVLTDDSSSMTFRMDKGEDPANPNSVTVLMSRLNRHLAEKVTEKGAMVLPQQKVDELVRENGKVIGVKIGPEELRARVVVAADGVLSFLAQEVGLRSGHSTDSYGVGIKEIIQLESSKIEDRFNLPPGQGAARLYMGKITQGLPGGGFIYTNIDTLSIGIVVHMKALRDWKSETESWELLEVFKARPDVAPLLTGGKTVEYGAHLVPEGGFKNLPKPGSPGFLLVGDAAGFVLNTGNTLRGMDLAIASGVLAGASIVQSSQREFSPEACLNHYEHALKASFIMKQMKAYKKAPGLLTLSRLYDRYPHRMVQLAHEMFRVNSHGQGMSFWDAFNKITFKILGWKGIKDMWRIIRMGK
ncbi:MAG: FAD-dependent oxidoreductase [Candidatus Aminicenantes bacterium]|jgi:electron transfer flavoprotein-quinone oxidoreductase